MTQAGLFVKALMGFAVGIEFRHLDALNQDLDHRQ